MLKNARPRHATVVAYLALFVALGGGAYATHTHKMGAKDIKKNAIRAKHVKNDAIRAKHVKKDAIRSKHVKNGHVRSADLADGAVSGAKLAEGAVTSATIADGSLRLRDLIVWEQTTSLGNQYPIGGYSCSTHNPTAAPAGAEPTDVVLVGYSDDDLPRPGFEVKQLLAKNDDGDLERHQRVCNTTANTLTFGSASEPSVSGATLMGLRP